MNTVPQKAEIIQDNLTLAHPLYPRIVIIIMKLSHISCTVIKTNKSYIHDIG
jgi:hypothetical protein